MSDLDATMPQVLARGGAIAMPRMPIPGVGWLACFHDSEGNILGVTQPEPAAK